jgi:type I site-specific restriction endonuclease
MTISLDLLKHSPNLKKKKEDGKVKLFDPIRKKYIVATPEESVRQLLTLYLLEDCAYPKNSISIEKMLIVNDLRKRFDMLIYDETTEPFLIVECKAPNIRLSDDVFRQAATYNFQLKAPYLVISNGMETYCCKMNYEEETYVFMEALPAYITS